MGFSISLLHTGPWVGDFQNRALAVKNAKLIDDGIELPWFVKHPDRRIEIVSYHGDHLDWVRSKT